MYPLSTASAASFLFTLLLFFHLTASCPWTDPSNLPDCNQTFSCGALTNITCPFTGGQRPPYCGHPEFHLACSNDLVTTLTANPLPYRVTQVNQTGHTLRLSLVGLYNDSQCIYPFNNTTFDDISFSLACNQATLSLFCGCKNLGDSVMANTKFSCPRPGYSEEGFFKIGDPGPVPQCRTSFQVPFLQSRAQQLQAIGSSLLVEVLKEGFDVSYSNPYSDDNQKCYKPSGGQSGLDGEPICICDDQLLCPEKSSNRKQIKIGVSLASGAVLVIIVGGWVMIVKRMKKRKSAMEQCEGLPAVTPTSANFFRATPSIANSNSGIGKSSAYFGVRVFSYNELEEATNCFDSSKQLGDGGFGTVYYGLLRDGREVAVKRLYESNMRRAVQFMNEIKILADLRHRNLVKLHGCTSRHGRELLLVYEYIPNGTVADHLHGRQSNSALEAVDITRRGNEINLSTMAVNKIQSQALNELVDPFLGFDKDFVVREMVTSVAELAFRCLQLEREMRPTMEEVVEELRGIERENYGAGKEDIENQGR
ncbi:hypothetical protein SADUNF_Sadunf04G0068800 [Salix dunnii]|uniref:non-specific serine/threonine protein kinase n=1 Tax=Salix dunnii TaxID=1413687 RepID=A0A835KAJ2_9ROSI|nr:hypothetical protein SADUNF_Sadunf04G0068800 [Salix dunnii]